MMKRLRAFAGSLAVPERCFLFIFAIFGLLFLVIIPPMQVADETSHFYRAYQISQFNLLSERTKVGVGGVLPYGVVGFTGGANKYGLSFHAERRFYPRMQLAELSRFEDGGLKIPVQFVNTAIYAPISYVAPATGIAIGKVVSNRIIVQFYMARLFCLAFFGACLYFAIRQIPRGKWALAVLALLPMTINEAAAVTADGFIIGVTALFIAMVYKLYAQTAITRLEWIVLGVIAVLIALSKQSYIVLVPAVLLLLWPIRQGKPALKQTAVFVAAICAAALIATALWTVASNQFNHDFAVWAGQNGIKVDPDGHIAQIMANPLRLGGLLANTWLTNNANPYFASFFGTFGWLDTPLPLLLQVGLALVIFLSFGLRESNLSERVRIPWQGTVLLVGLVLLNVAMIGAIVYAYWTPKGQFYISGYQGRYLIPLLILLVPVLIGRYTHSISRRTVMIAMVALLICSTAVISFRYYNLPAPIPHSAHPKPTVIFK
jgi:uncharacterized membrane protein